jgi:hypothetical protein
MPLTPFQYFLGRENQRKVEILEKNHDIAGFFDGLLDHLVNFSNREGVPIENIQIKDAWIAGDKRINALITWQR